MLTYLLLGVGAVAVFAVIVIRNAEKDDKKRKLDKSGRSAQSNNN